jgi:2',3'-cyclic-nucleotide 2'-phosphodiesterase (5'-nucleotidase family)
MQRFKRGCAALAAGAVLALGAAPMGAQAAPPAGPAVFTLQILHASDLEGGVAALARAENFAAIIDKLEDDPSVDASITLSAGDNYIPGPFFSASGDASVQPVFNSVYNDLYGIAPAAVNRYDDLRAAGGRTDISIMNVIGFDASALGNHEFDLGTAVMNELLRPDHRSPNGPDNDRWVGTQFPYLSANLNFAADTANLAPIATTVLHPHTFFKTGPAESTAGLGNTARPKIAPFTKITRGGETIGVVGVTTPLLQSISSPQPVSLVGPTTNDMPALAAVLQPAINTLLADGIDKVVLVSHLQQIALEQALTPLLSGVDVVIAGGSDTILSNDPADSPAGGYPIVTTNADGDTAVIVSTDGEYSYVGRLVVDFDADGEIVTASGGPIRTTSANVTTLWGAGDPFALGTKGELVRRLVDAVEAVVIAKDGNVFGSTSVFIEGRRAIVRTQETNLGDITNDANIWLGKQYDPAVVIGLKNGGGVRAEIGEVTNTGGSTTLLPPQANPLSGKLTGQISQLDIENSLRFNNALSLVTLTATQLLQVIEHGVAATAPGATPGQFPQIGGMAFSYDPTLPAGDRVRTLAIVDAAGNVVDTVVESSVVVGDPNRTFRMVTLSFLVTGGDSYPFPSFPAAGLNRVDLVGQPVPGPNVATFAAAGTEQDAFAEYLAATHPTAGPAYGVAETPPSGDYRIQDLAVRPDTVQQGPAFIIPEGRMVLAGLLLVAAMGFAFWRLSKGSPRRRASAA